MRYAIFSDFDGTLTDHDTIDLLVEHHVGREYAEAMSRRLMEGELTIRETLDQEFARLRLSPDEIREFLLARVRVDATLPALAALARERGHRLTILSSGMDLLIAPLLEAAGCAVEVRCNRLHWTPPDRSEDGAEGGRFWVEYRDDSDNGHHKAAMLHAARAEGWPVIYLGDGITDLECASAADILFARGYLAEYCQRAGIAFRRLESCADVIRFLEEQPATGSQPASS